MSNVSLAEFKAWRKQNANFNAETDDIMQAALDAADAGINEGLQRQIGAVAVASARTFDVRGDCILRIDDCSTVTLIDGVAVDTTVYRLEPVGNRAPSGQWRPYEQIRSTSVWTGDTFGGVAVTATWGWTTIPVQVTEAAKILAKDILANIDVNFGIAAFTEYAGVRARSNPQVWDLVASLRRVESWGIA